MRSRGRGARWSRPPDQVLARPAVPARPARSARSAPRCRGDVAAAPAGPSAARPLGAVGGCRCRRGGQQRWTDGGFGLADLPGSAASASARPGGRGRRHPDVRHRPRHLPVCRAPDLPRRGLSGAGGPAGARLHPAGAAGARRPGGLQQRGPAKLAGVAVPPLPMRSGRRASARVAAARGELSMHVVDLLHGAPELLAYGAADTQLDRVARSDAELTGLSRSTALTTGLGAGLGSVAAGLALWGTLRVAVPAVSAGSLDGVWLAVLVLTALAVFEVVAPLPVAAQQLERVRRAAGRVFGVLDAPAPVNDPARPRPVPAGTPVVTLEAARLQPQVD